MLCGLPPHPLPRESCRAISSGCISWLYLQDAGWSHSFGIMRCYLGFPAASSLAFYSKCLLLDCRGGTEAECSRAPINAILTSCVEQEALILISVGTWRRNSWPCKWSQSETSLVCCIVPFFPKGNIRETKGNFCSWFPRQRSSLMVGCFQRAWVSGQYEFFFFLISWTKAVDVVSKTFSQLLRWTDGCFRFHEFGTSRIAVSDFDENK